MRFFGLIFVLLIQQVFAMTQDSPCLQISTFKFLQNGYLVGDMPFSTIKEKNNFAIGITNHADGEIVALNGEFFLIGQRCQLEPLDLNLCTPYTVACNFYGKQSFPLSREVNLKTLNQSISRLLPNHTDIFAVLIEGDFTSVVMRALKAKPLKQQNLAEIIDTQYVQHLRVTKGSAIGFWFPDELMGLAAMQLHLHFITQDKKMGGHVLDCSISKAKVSIMPCQLINLIMPHGPFVQQRSSVLY